MSVLMQQSCISIGKVMLLLLVVVYVFFLFFFFSSDAAEKYLSCFISDSCKNEKHIIKGK